ncbi:MAG: peroxiredoxin family protein [Chloroflexi bacterium]|nr:peroxiredoxin family protein [Chloroflexota bacterium]
MPKLRPGDTPPDFSLPDLKGKHFRLHDHLDGRKTLLLFFRGEWCPICNIQLHALQEKAAEFEKENAQIVAVSTDTAENSLKLAGKHNLGFPLLVGLKRETADAYDLYYNEERRCAEPAVFVIRPSRSIAYASLQSGPLGRPSVDDLLNIVRRA